MRTHGRTRRDQLGYNAAPPDAAARLVFLAVRLRQGPASGDPLSTTPPPSCRKRVLSWLLPGTQ